MNEVDKKVQFVVVSWLDAEQIIGVSQKAFAKRIRTADWVRKRCRIFKDFTMQSLLNQSFDDFRIWLYCGKKHQVITSAFDFGPRVEVCYDYGLQKMQELESPWFSLTRIDSDDCFHRDAMLEVRNKTELQPTRTTMGFRDLIQWNILQNFISDIRIIVSPFTTHCWPRSQYQNWHKIKTEQFGLYRRQPIVLSQRKVCIIRHRDNVTWPRIGKDPGSKRYFQQEKAKRNRFITDRSRIVNVLKDFGIREEQVPMRRRNV